MCSRAMLFGSGARGADGPVAAARTPTDAGDSDIQPFSSHYVAEWKDISVGRERSGAQAGHAAGALRLQMDDQQRGEFSAWCTPTTSSRRAGSSIVDDHVKPDRYRGRQGSASVNFDFDWDAGHAHRDLRRQADRYHARAGYPGSQLHPDPGHARSQEWQLARAHSMSSTRIRSRDSVCARGHCAASRPRSAPTTPSSSPAATPPTTGGSYVCGSRVDLGWVPVQAERTHGGKLEFAMRIRSLTREGERLSAPP